MKPTIKKMIQVNGRDDLMKIRPYIVCEFWQDKCMNYLFWERCK